MSLTHEQIVRAMVYKFPGVAFSVDQTPKVIAWPDGVTPLTDSEMEQAYAEFVAWEAERVATAQAHAEALNAAPKNIDDLIEAVDALLLAVLEP